MCGIAGCLDIDSHEERRKVVHTMVQSMRHRGPDDYGVVSVSQEPVCVLGQSRLSIIDLSPDGHQPMTDDETGNIIVFNGEIYNFKTLRDELSGYGQIFKTVSDTEVILKSYAYWGEDCARRLKGIFAFAIWDAKKQHLYVARDPLGVKPLYYYTDGHNFLFASEVRSLLSSNLIQRRLDMDGLMSYFSYGSVQEPYTLVQGIKSVPPASSLTVKKNGQKITSYRDVFSEHTANSFHSRADAQEAVTAALSEAVSLQMVSDVPLGAFLSGGIDSSAIVALMRKAHPEGDLRTFSIVFEETEYDERIYAQKVAAANGTRHTELELTGSTVKSLIGKALNSFDMPSMDGLNTWFVSKLVKDAGLTVALSGVGGDELFVGYGAFGKARILMRWQRLFGLLPRCAGYAIESVASNERLRKVAQLVGWKAPGYFLSRQVYSDQQIRSLVAYPVSQQWRERSFLPLISSVKGVDDISAVSRFELSTYMLSTLLRDTDQMSMAHSLEVRVPLIDPDLVALVSSLPSEWKLDPSIAKPFLVNAAGAGIPYECVHRPKRGFCLPFDKWFSEALRPEILDFVNGHVHTCFNGCRVNELWRNYQAGRVTWSRVWMLYVLQKWMCLHKIDF